MPLDEDDKKVVQDLIKAAFTGEDFTKAVSGTVETTVGKAIKGLKLDEQIGTALTKALEARKPKEQEPEPPKEGGKVDPATLKLQSELEKVQKQLQQEAEARQAAEEARKTERLHTAVRDALAKAGVPADRMKHALALLQAEGRLAYGEGDVPGLKFVRPWGEEILPAEKAAAEWVQSDDGKVYLPAKGTQGTGEGAHERPTAAPRTKDGATDWNALKGRIAPAALQDALDR